MKAATQPGRSSGLGEKYIVIVRHGHSSWNEQSRIQGATDESQLTAKGRSQAIRVRESIAGINFDSCFASPHTRARQTVDIIWTGRTAPLCYLDNLREADLGWFQGKTNETVAREFPDIYRCWREEPEKFCIDGRHPVLDAFKQAQGAWKELLAAPGSRHLIITHKSILRSLLCTALGLPPSQFRSMDISNGGICMVRIKSNRRCMLSALNLTSHLDYDVAYTLPEKAENDTLFDMAAEKASVE